MKKSRFIWGMAALAAGALLLPTAVSAQTTAFTATGWVNGVQSPPIICTNALGQVLFRGVVHTARVQATNPRVTGQVLILTDGAYNPDGTANLQGPSYLQVGTWDAAGTNFTPTGGLWEMTWRGVMQTNNSLVLDIVAHGSGGAIDGWRLEMTVTRASAAGPIDPAVPYLYTGTIKPPPINSLLYTEDFSHGPNGWGFYYNPPPPGSATYLVSNQQLVLHADFRGVPGPDPVRCSYWVYAPSATWSIGDGQTLEAQVDLVSISPNAANWALLWVGTGSECYIFAVSPQGASLTEWRDVSGLTTFWRDDNVQFPNPNLILRLAVSRAHQNAIITTRVLDKNAADMVLFERGFVHTPQMAPGPPILSGKDKGLAVYQESDGSQPPLDAIFDNFSLRLRDEPPLSIARAVRLTWPAPAGVNYSLEGAPTVQGPWLPVQELDLPGFQKLTVPVSGPAQFFRLQQAPQ